MGALLSTFASWLIDILLYVPRQLFSLLLQGLAAVLTAIPAPSWLSNIPSTMSGISSGIWYFAACAQIGTGMTIVISAYVLRFLIRRIPLIG